MVLVLSLFNGCTSPVGPVDPWQYGGELEIMLETPVTDLRDFTKTCVGFYNTQYGGTSASYWILAASMDGIRTWTATVNLNCSPQPWYLGTPSYDLSVIKFYLRRKGDTTWLRLTCIVPHPQDPKYEALKLMFNNGQLQNAC